MSRFVQIKRRSKYDEYGFEFRTDKTDGKHICFNVDPDKPAYLAGLRDGDYILEINDEPVSGLWSDAVKMKITAFPRKVDILVVNDIDSYIKARRKSILEEQYISNNEKNLHLLTYEKEEIYDRNRNSEIYSVAKSLNINREDFESKYSAQGKPFISRRISGSNVVNGHLMPKDLSYKRQTQKYDSSSNLMVPASSSDYKKVLQNRRKTDVSLNRNQMKEEQDSAVQSLATTDATALEDALTEYGRKIRLEKEETDGLHHYGFNFRMFKSEGLHVITNIMPDTPSFNAGIRNGDYLLEVNGEIMTGLAHNQVLKKILHNPKHVNLLVVNNIESYMTTKQTLSHIQNQNRSNSETSNRYWLKKLPNKDLGLTIVPNGIIKFVEPFSQADKAGIMKGQKIISINDVDVRTKQNREILQMIKENEKYFVLEMVQLYDTKANNNATSSKKLTEYKVNNLLDSNPILVETSKQRTSKENRQQEQRYRDHEPGPKLFDEFPRNQRNVNDNIYDSNKHISRRQSSENHHGPDRADTASLKQQRQSEYQSPPSYSPRSPSVYESKKKSTIPIQQQQPKKSSLTHDNIIKKQSLTYEPVAKKSIKPPVKVDNRNNSLNIYAETAEIDIHEPVEGILRRPSEHKKVKMVGSRQIKIYPVSSYAGYGCELTWDEENEVAEIGRVIPKSPASMSSIKQGDVILRINNESMTGRQFSEIFNIFSKETLEDPEDEFGESLVLEVIERSICFPDFIETRNQKHFKRCRLFLEENQGLGGFGLVMSTNSVRPKHYIIDVEPFSIAYRANLRKHDVIIEIDQKNIRHLSESEVLRLLESGAYNRELDILAISYEGYNYYKQKNYKFSSKKLTRNEEKIDTFNSKERESKWC